METMMKRTFLMTAAAAALIAGAGLASAQDKQQTPRAGTSPAPAAQQAAPAEKSAAPMTQGTTGQGASSDTKMDQPAAAEAPDKAKGRSRNAQDMKSKSMDKNAQSQENKAGRAMSNDSKSSNGMKSSSDTNQRSTTGQSSPTDTSKQQTSPSSSQTQMNQTSPSGQRNTTGQSGTTGQGAAATSGSVNLSTEQRTQISTVIKETKVQPVTNVNFSLSIGTHVPRTVRFHPLPSRVVAIYPEWRGYDFILVGNQIVIINPRTYEIVFILEA
jgi:hypothetical protein